MPNQTPQAGSNQQQITATDGTPLNPLAVNIAKAIRQTESQGNYNAVGDNGDSHGAYQFNKDNFQNWAKEYNLDPNDFSPINQDKVAYTRINNLLKEGRSPSEVAAVWNGAKNINGKYEAINPAYVEKVKNNYAQIVGSPQGSQLATSPQIAQASTENQNNQTQTKSQVPDYAGAIGNFLFPAVGDIANIIKGKNTKSGLEIAGDVGLSVLPFIPGLGEIGLAARGAKAGVEGAKLAEGAGLLSKAASVAATHPVATAAVSGYGTGVAQNLSEGKSLGQSVAPDINTVGGALLGGGLAGGIKAVGALRKSAAGIDPVVENYLKGLGVEANPENVQLYDKYIQAAKTHATEVSPSVENIAADNLDQAAKTISQRRTEAGAAVGAAKEATKAIPLAPQTLSPVAQSFAKKVEDDFGLKLASDEAGNVTATPVEGSFSQISPTDKVRIENAATQLNKLYNSGNGTVRNVSEVISNLDNDLTYNAKPYGQAGDVLDGLMSSLRNDLNKQVVRPASPALAAANDRFSSINRLQKEIRDMAGNKLQRGELLMSRVLGNRSADSLALFDKIKKETGVDLVKHAILAKHAIQAVGSNADKSTLARILEQAAKEGGAPTLTGLLMQGGKGTLQKFGANPERIGRSLVKGPTLLKTVGKVGKGIPVGAGIESTRLIRSLLGLQ